MRLILTFVLSVAFSVGMAQQKEQWPKVTFEWYTEADNYFKGFIDNRYPITMYINFTPKSVVIDKYEGYYPNMQQFENVYSGWYYYNSRKDTIPLIGIMLSGSDKLILYVPDRDTLINYRNIELSVNINRDSCKIWGPDRKELQIAETFEFSKGGVGQWTYKNKVKKVEGINIDNLIKYDFAGLHVRYENGFIGKVNLLKTMRDLGTSIGGMYHLVNQQNHGYQPSGIWHNNEHGYHSRTILNDGKINVHLGFSNSEVPCRMSYGEDLFVTVDKNLQVIDYSMQILGHCNRFTSMDDASGVTKIVCYKNQEVVSDFIRKDEDYIIPDSLSNGAYKIVDSKIIIIDPYQGDCKQK